MSTKDTNPKDALASDRAPLDLLPPVVKVEASLALAEGEFKYGGGNWTTAGVRARVYIAALGRHLERYSAGMDRDHNGVHELARVIAGCSVVIDAEHRGVLTDDRIYKMDNFEKVLDQASATMKKLRAEFAKTSVPPCVGHEFEPEAVQLELPFTGKQLAVKDLTAADIGKRFRVVDDDPDFSGWEGVLHALCDGVAHFRGAPHAYSDKGLLCCVSLDWRFERI